MESDSSEMKKSTVYHWHTASLYNSESPEFDTIFVKNRDRSKEELFSRDAQNSLELI